MAKTRRWASVLGTAAAVAFVGGPFLAHFRIVPAIAGFGLFALGGLLGIVTLVAGIVGAFRRGWGAAATSLGLGGLISAIFVLVAIPGRRVPPINDITTDTANPPQFVKAGSLPANQGRDMAYPGTSFAEQQRAGYPDLAPLTLSVPPDEAFQLVQAAAKQMPDWEVTRVDASARALEGIATSRLFRFQDDFVIEVRPHDGGSVIEMRSKSRNGKGDVGANAARINSVFGKLK